MKERKNGGNKNPLTESTDISRQSFGRKRGEIRRRLCAALVRQKIYGGLCKRSKLNKLCVCARAKGENFFGQQRQEKGKEKKTQPSEGGEKEEEEEEGETEGKKLFSNAIR